MLDWAQCTVGHSVCQALMLVRYQETAQSRNTCNGHEYLLIDVTLRFVHKCVLYNKARRAYC
jgi:hypothetical protein